MTEPLLAGCRDASLVVSREELERARERIGRPEWRAAAERLSADAEALATAERPLPAFDTAWYDQDPDRPFAETYSAWHDYIDPGAQLGRDAMTLLKAALVLEKGRYLAPARDWTMHLVDHLKFYPRHYDAGLDYARVAAALSDAYVVLEPALADDARERMVRSMIRCGEAIAESFEQWLSDPHLSGMPYNNHLAFHRRALMALGLALDRRAWVDEALGGRRNFGELLVGATRDDGLCYESSTHYHYATAGALVGMAELARHRPDLGRDLYREQFANGRCLKQMLDAPLGLLLPNGELAAMGDCYARRDPFWAGRGNRLGLYELAFGIYGDPRYAWLVAQGGERDGLWALLYGADALEPAEAPLGRSRVWVEHGYALLTSRLGRAYWDGSGVVAVLGGDRSGVHHHRGAFGLQVFAGGRLWLEDVESETVNGHGFSEPIQPEFNRTMLAHNVVVVDEREQQALARPLQVTELKDLAACRVLSMSDLDGRVAAGVRMIRSLVVTPEFCLDVFQLASDQEHTWDWLAHPRSDGPVETGVAMSPTSLPDRPPYARLRGAASAPLPDGRAALRWSQGEQGFRCDVTGSRPATLIRAEWPVRSDWSSGGREMFMVRARGTSVDVAAVYQLAGERAVWRVESVERHFNGLENEMRLAVGNGTDSRRFVFESL